MKSGRSRPSSPTSITSDAVLEFLNPHTDAARWAAILGKMPEDCRDVHFTPAYARVQEYLGGCAELAVKQTPHGMIIQPFLRRRVMDSERHTDLTSFYGFGGPLTSIRGEMDRMIASIEFGVELGERALSQGIVTEYCCLHPLLLKNQLKVCDQSGIKLKKEVVVIDLAEFSEKTVHRRVRRGIRAGRENGQFAELSTVDHYIGRFVELYNSSMVRKNAPARLRFPPLYLEALFKEAGARLFCTIGREGMRMLMTLEYDGTAYAHLLASNGLEQHAGLDDLLYFETARRLSGKNLQLHLGGGATDDPADTLLSYKSTFSERREQSMAYTRIFDGQAYKALCDAKARLEFNEYGRESTAAFFPAYRREWA